MPKSPKFGNLRLVMKHFGHLVAGSMGVAVADLISKSYAQQFLLTPVGMPPFFQLALAKNTGLAFGVSAPNRLIVLASLLAVFYLLYLYRYQTHADRLLSVATFTLLIGGAFGNLYERIVYGSVTDFISLLAIPHFNLADTALTFGVIILFVFHSKIFIKPL